MPTKYIHITQDQSRSAFTTRKKVKKGKSKNKFKAASKTENKERQFNCPI
jgi:hypothetical protein